MLADEGFSEYVGAAKAAGNLADVSTPRRGGKAPLPDAYYRRTAALYLEEIQHGVPGLLARIARRLSKELGREVPADTAKDWAQKARNKFHYLTPTKQGRAAGTQAGPRLLAEWAEGQVPLRKATASRGSPGKRATPRRRTVGPRHKTKER